MPKLAEAWVDITTKDAQFYKGMGNARKEVEATTTSFSRGTSIMVRSAERPWRALRRIFNILKEVARQTEDGKFAVEDADKAWGGLVNQMVAAVTGGMDMARVFEVLASIMRGLTKNTDEWAITIAGAVKTLLEARLNWLGWVTGDTDGDRKAIKQQIDDISQYIRDKNNEITKKDVAAAQKRADAAKKEGDAKRAEFMSITDAWKDMQRRLFDRPGMGSSQDAGNGGAGGRGLALPAGPLGMGPKSPPANLPGMWPANGPQFEQGEGMKHMVMELLEQSGNAEDRREAERMRRDEEQLRVLQSIDRKSGPARFGK